MYKVYQVKSGDTLGALASLLGINVNELAGLNGLMVSAPLVAGQYIIIPNKNENKYFTEYTIKKGDTIYEIARRLNVDPSSLLRLNGISKNDLIYPDEQIIIPRENVTFYVTGQDDTLADVSKKLNASIADIGMQNGTIYLTNDQLIVYKKWRFPWKITSFLLFTFYLYILVKCYLCLSIKLLFRF